MDTIAYIVGAVLLVAVLVFIIKKLSAKSATNSIRFRDLDDDDIIYDPETGASISYEDAMADKALKDPKAESGTPLYDEETATKITFENLPPSINEKVSERIVELIIRLHGQYQLLIENENANPENEVDYMHNQFLNSGIISLDKDIIEAVLEAEKIYARSLES